MVRENYEAPEMEVTVLENEDVIVTSGDLWETPIV